MDDKEYYETAGKGLKLSGRLCIILSFLFYFLDVSLNQIDYVELFLMGSLVYVSGNLLLED